MDSYLFGYRFLHTGFFRDGDNIVRDIKIINGARWGVSNHTLGSERMYGTDEFLAESAGRWFSN